MQQTIVPRPTNLFILAVDRFALWVGRHWLALFVVSYGAWVLTPFLAPILMEIGATAPAHGIYLVYSFFCHQLPERSLFFFGPQPMYSYAQIKAAWPLDGFDGLRQFIGNPQMGYKMAWSDRMISFYGSFWVGGLLFGLLRTRLKSLPIPVWLIAGILPVGLDGLTHMLNDILAATNGTGFRDTNAWLQALTGNVFPQWFYIGDALGSFNSDARWITGILFGLTTIWLLFPFIEEQMIDVTRRSTAELERALSEG
jgi:uncharacterized membrane protein